MSELSDFFESKHRQLANDYRDASGNSSDHCGLIARAIDGLLTSEGKKTQILYLSGIKVDELNTKPLVPTAFEGRVKWAGHTVCVAEGIVYDPILETPVPIEDYPMRVFGTDILAREAAIGDSDLLEAK